MICDTCHEEKECRPYGPANAPMICFQCAFATEEAAQTTNQNFFGQLIVAASLGNGSVILGEETGPRPMTAKNYN